ncbi:hypothetical protein SLEP1_g30034 [Rubroshorea leprosula]|uniref:Uncharacterized protein n=1 Tax=Rubroshorea leprosula TaxID=152421 RepID=A0AAV5K6T7_9ROSI|nr:hypothetical protein SLEP1_g30034 [Rubroshorea leprosula]
MMRVPNIGSCLIIQRYCKDEMSPAFPQAHWLST